ncbi:MAG: hypothetical protein GY822_12180 [Deltaproteobacteria bacterium]|nr:hypothetical protein [Deltaproteobacteria bacterium]
MTALLDEEKSYRCKDAHKNLKWLGNLRVDGEAINMVYQRGTRRVMLSLAGWDTVCMDLRNLHDDKGLLKLWNGATKRFIKDRHDNP